MDQHHYQRIDKGIKRRNGKVTLPSDPADTGTWKIPEGLDPKAIIEQYLTESTTSQIARQHGLSRKALTKWLREQLPNEWKQVQILRALSRKDDGDNGIDRACDPLSLARAREQLKSAQWDLERLDSQTFGQKQEINHTVQIVDLDQTLQDQAKAILLSLGKHTGIMSTSTPNQINTLEGQAELVPEPAQEAEGGGYGPDFKPASP